MSNYNHKFPWSTRMAIFNLRFLFVFSIFLLVWIKVYKDQGKLILLSKVCDMVLLSGGNAEQIAYV